MRARVDNYVNLSGLPMARKYGVCLGRVRIVPVESFDGPLWHSHPVILWQALERQRRPSSDIERINYERVRFVRRPVAAPPAHDHGLALLARR